LRADESASIVLAMSTTLSDLPPEMRAFTILKTTTSLAPRIGRLALAGRNVLETPHYLGNTSRGAVSHISQDNFRRNTHINGVYVALEDCMSPLLHLVEDMGTDLHEL
jgi:queuine tRNA-ribosyltransferase